MKDYRLYLMNDAGRFVGVVELAADSDDEAIAAARSNDAEVAKELWDHDRLVQTFQPAHHEA